LARAVSLLAALVFLDVFATTADLSWTREVANPERSTYLPDVQPRGPRVMRLEEASHTRIALSEKAYSEEQLRQATLLQPMTNVAMHASVLDPYGFYLDDVAKAMGELATSQPLLLAEVTATDLVLAAPGSRAPWLADAVDRRRLIPTHSSRAGAVALRVEHALPRSFLATSAALLPRAEIPHRLGDGSGQVLLIAERSLMSGHFAPLDRSAIPAQMTVSPPSEQPACGRPDRLETGGSHLQACDVDSRVAGRDGRVPSRLARFRRRARAIHLAGQRFWPRCGRARGQSYRGMAI
jgi:hypothetical protein